MPLERKTHVERVHTLNEFLVGSTDCERTALAAHYKVPVAVIDDPDFDPMFHPHITFDGEDTALQVMIDACWNGRHTVEWYDSPKGSGYDIYRIQPARPPQRRISPPI